ncbi:hypothetical protein [Chitinophaga pinensis]|uniref:Uncharacterized protein n=1 Tax=Chitinophaga pinensis (strain ATCC 43595 / DSM 2588 / LMG 13176 / NBRC 15968 / NCIMB 11800 / UQM 2034) TaxID=485918 RepID=A0A979GQG0_CHIPD|nr:hypothetical protein [Chitinophaga pinensis]ACU59988.1 hypothetical protein Cpin_2500 [Chitinophaga pinensis DSM 2588]
MEKTKRNNLLIVIGVVLGTTVGGWLGQKLVFVNPSFEKTMNQAANEINKKCPLLVDKETRIDNAVVLPGNVFQYNYTLVNFDRAAIDTTLLKQSIEPTILNNIKTNPLMAELRNHKTTIAYNYVDKKGIFIVRMVFTAERYN